MNYRQRQWPAKDHQLFITVLTETGNPAVAAAAIGRSLAAAHAMRDRWPALANDWSRALGIAWEQVEMRLLATLLDDDGKIDAKVAMEMLKRRPAAPKQAIVTIDAALIGRVRDEVRALAAPVEMPPAGRA